MSFKLWGELNSIFITHCLHLPLSISSLLFLSLLLSLLLSLSSLSVSLSLSQGEDEAMFVEYRKQLKMLLDRLAQVSPDLLLEAVGRVFNNTIQ